MAYQKLQVGLAAVVIPSDTVDIPLISSSRLTGTNTGPAAANKLLDSSASFDTVQGFITPGAIVVNETDGTKTIVNSVDSATELSLEIIDYYKKNFESISSIIGITRHDNIASIRVLNKCGLIFCNDFTHNNIKLKWFELT